MKQRLLFTFSIICLVAMFPSMSFAQNSQDVQLAKSQLASFVSSKMNGISYDEKENAVVISIDASNADVMAKHPDISTEWAITNLAKNVAKYNDFYILINDMKKAKASFSFLLSNAEGKVFHANVPNSKLDDVITQSKVDFDFLCLKSKMLIGNMTLPEFIETGLYHTANDLSAEKGFTFIYELDAKKLGVNISSQSELEAYMKEHFNFHNALSELVRTESDSYEVTYLLVSANLPHRYQFHLKGSKLAAEEVITPQEMSVMLNNAANLSGN